MDAQANGINGSLIKSFRSLTSIIKDREMINPDVDALPFARFRKGAISMDERPIFLMWGAYAAVSAETIMITCCEQFQETPSKAKSKVIYDWLVNQDSDKPYGWGSVGLQADGVQDKPSIAAAVNKVYADSKYYINRKSWIGKLKGQIDGNLGNTPPRDMYDLIVEIAINNAQATALVAPYSNKFDVKMNPRDQIGMVTRLKGLEMVEKQFSKAGFNTAKMGFRLPFVWKVK